MSERKLPKDTVLVHPRAHPERSVRITVNQLNSDNALDDQAEVERRWIVAEEEESTAPTFDDLTSAEQQEVRQNQLSRANRHAAANAGD